MSADETPTLTCPALLPGPTHDDSARLYDDPEAMTEYHAVLASRSASLLCEHDVSLYETCLECGR